MIGGLSKNRNISITNLMASVSSVSVHALPGEKRQLRGDAHIFSWRTSMVSYYHIMLASVNLNIQQRALQFYAITTSDEIPTSRPALNHPAFQSSCLEHRVSPNLVLKIKELLTTVKVDMYGVQKCFMWIEYADGMYKTWTRLYHLRS